MKKRFLNFFVFFLGITQLTIPTFAQEKTHLKLADVGWDSIRVHNAVVGYIATYGYDLTWEEVPASAVVTFEALKKGEMDLLIEAWSDTLPTYHQDVEAGLLLDFGVNFDDNKQGLYVPAYVIYGDASRGIEPMAPDLKTVQDLKKYPEVFADPENPGKGRIYGAIPGWEVDKIVYNKYKFNGLDKDFTYFSPGSDAALTTAFASAYDRGEAIVGYYWEPTWITGLIDLVLLEDYPYQADKYQAGEVEFPSVKVQIAGRLGIDEDFPEFSEFLYKYRSSSALTSEALAYMQEHNTEFDETAKWFIKENADLIQTMVNPEAWLKIYATLDEEIVEAEKSFFYRFPFTLDINTDIIDQGFRKFAEVADPVLVSVRNGLNKILNFVDWLIALIPWWIYVLGAGLVGYRETKKVTTAVIYGAMVYFIGMVGLWDLTLTTLSVVIASVVVSLILGFPLGILIASSDNANKIVRPILDGMQTMPIFIYLIPAVLLFGLGKVPGVIATVIYAIVPIIRLTNLGIRQVDQEVVEAAKAFGSTRLQSLIKVQIPQAFPTIMAGVNQTLMMAMAMVVTTSMIGVAGLGLEVLYSVNRIQVGRGLVSGLAVVIVAILLDRVSQNWQKTSSKKGD